MSNPPDPRILAIHLYAGVLTRKLYRQTLPALLSTLAENLSSPLCLHPRPEPVLLDPALVARTISRLAHE